MDESLVDDAGAVVTEGVDSEAEQLLAVDPSVQTLRTLVETAFEANLSSELVVLAPEETFKATFGDFIVASKAAALREAESLSLRVLASSPDNSLFATPATVVITVPTDDGVVALSLEDDTLIEQLYTTYHEQAESASSFTLRAPSIRRLTETLEKELSAPLKTDFEAVLEATETIRQRRDPVGEVEILLLLTAKHEALLYDISKWGEDVGVASKATFSRAKTRLEDAGLLDTEKVPIDVGRPRLRLLLPEELAGFEPAELVETATDRLADKDN